MKDKAVAGALEAVARYIPNRVGSGYTGLTPPAFVAAEVQRRLSRATTALLNAFVKLHASHSNAVLSVAMSDPAWLNAKSLTGPRPFVIALQACVQKAAADALLLLPRGESLPFCFLPAVRHQ